MRSCAIHVHKHSVEAMLLQQCREVTTVILSITPWLPTYVGQCLIWCNIEILNCRFGTLIQLGVPITILYGNIPACE